MKSGATGIADSGPVKPGVLYTSAFFIGFLYNFVIALHFTSSALYPLYVTHEHGGAATIGLFMGVYSLAGVLGRPLIALLIDRYGPRKMLIVGSLCLSLPAFGYIALLGSGIGFSSLALRILQGLGYGAHFSATFTLAASLAPPERRNEAVAMYGVSGLLGAMVGPYVGEQLVITHGFAAFFSAMGGIGIVAAIIIGFIPANDTAQLRFPKPLQVLRTFRASGMLMPVALAFLFAISFSSPTTFLATLALQRGIPDFSLYFTLWGVSGVVVRFIGGRWGDRLGLRRVLIPGFAFYAVGLLIIAFSSTTTGLMLAGVLCGFGHGISFPAVTSLGHSLAPPEYSGSAMALVTGMMDFGASVNAFVIGPLAAVYGYTIVFPVAAAASITAFLILIVQVSRHPEKRFLQTKFVDQT
jgi:MFS family permease